jgi:hypothetical protein
MIIIKTFNLNEKVDAEDTIIKLAAEFEIEN